MTPSWISSSATIVAVGQPMPVLWTETRLPAYVPGVAEQAALAVRLDDVVEVRLGDVLGAERVAGEQTGLGVVAGLRSQVDRHPAKPYGFRALTGSANRRL